MKMPLINSKWCNLCFCYCTDRFWSELNYIHTDFVYLRFSRQQKENLHQQHLKNTYKRKAN